MEIINGWLPIVNTILLLLAIAFGAGKLSTSVKVLQAGNTELRKKLNTFETAIRGDLSDLYDSLSDTKADVAFLKGQWEGSGAGKK